MPKSMDYICLKDGHDWTGKPPSERERVKGRNTNLPRVPCPECGEYTGVPAEKLEKSGDSVTIDGKPIPRELWSDPEIQESAKEDILKSLGATDPEIEKLHQEIRSLERREPREPSVSKKKRDELEAEAYKKGIDFLDDIRPLREVAQELKGEVKDFKNFIESSGKKNYFYAKILERLGFDVSDLKHEALEDMLGLAKSRSQKRKKSAAAASSSGEPWEDSVLDKEDYMELERRMKVIYDEDMTQEELESELVEQVISIMWNSLPKYEFFLGMSLARSLGIADEVRSISPEGRWARVVEKAVDRGFEEGWFEEFVEDKADQFEELKEFVDECKKQGILEDVMRVGLLGHVDKNLHPPEAR